ncbi:helix-turn-helix domain-containing protein [Lysobacter sp. A6]|uniref:Helix-turn-helix domain-containing protein n=1 Tax=Noviluteimonas lactosilytica TaxID=2888523 RepID=A0ABS8JI36_9GAMM|nr:helix-turn-helix domain-containing protein [Lysobacter lactosilyticus]MCC8363273.1 helix-turn-helix domain-containing protein [Lysobacter lactosilyticus]
MAASTDSIVFTIDDFRERHGVSRSYVYGLINSGELEVIHYGRRPRITAAAEKQFMRRMAVAEAQRSHRDRKPTPAQSTQKRTAPTGARS